MRTTHRIASLACSVVLLSLPAAALAGTWVLSWSDEFNGPTGNVDSTHWTALTYNDPSHNEQPFQDAGNGNLQYYEAQNSLVDGSGDLAITAKYEPLALLGKSCYPWGSATACMYSSGMVRSKPFTQQYGRFEARIKLPSGAGLLPAFWMLGNNFNNEYGQTVIGWPQAGEIDIMESNTSAPTNVFSTLHGPLHNDAQNGEAHAYGVETQYNTVFPGNTTNFTADYHVYAVEWAPNEIHFYVDNVLLKKLVPTDVTSSPVNGDWVFDHPFFILLNLAIGGPNGLPLTTTFPQQMLVDYVRVYTCNGGGTCWTVP